MTYLEGTLCSQGFSSRSSEERTVPGAINNELSTWSTCFLFSFFLLLVEASIDLSSNGFSGSSGFGASWG